MNTLIDMLYEKQSQFPEKSFLKIWNRNNEIHEVTFESLIEESKKYAKYLKDKNLQVGDKVLLMVLTKVEFFYAYFGIMMAGGIPVPIHPPIFITEWDDYKEKFNHIFSTSQPKFIICYSEVLRSVESKLLENKYDKDRIILIDKLELYDNVENFIVYRPKSNEIAYIQYTSGTTDLPKGVMVTHEMLLKNINSIRKGINLSSKDTMVSWLPLYHDMGLIGTVLAPLYCDSIACLIPTEYFAIQPINLFKVITDFKGTVITAPNYGYVICNKYVNHKKMKDIDLSTLRLALVGADHIEFNDLSEFNDKFSCYGFDINTLLPVYGFAETGLAVSFSKIGEKLNINFMDRDALSKDGKIIITEKQVGKSISAIAVGKAVQNQEIMICDENNTDVGEGILGEICVRSDMITKGYINQEDKTYENLKNGWFKTGDYGYIANDVLYFFERKKDLIRKKNKFYKPTEFEYHCWKVDDIKRGRSAVIGIEKDGNKEDQDIYLLIETGTLYEEKYLQIIEMLNEIYKEHMGITPDYVHVVARGSIPQTSSGKTQRYKCKNKILDGSFDTNFIYDNNNNKILLCK